MEPEIEGIGHWVIRSRNGYRYMSIECPICKIWIEGPVIIEDGSIHLMETWPAETHEIVEMTSKWQKRLTKEAEIPFDKLHIHVQMVNLFLDPDYFVSRGDGFIEYYLAGEGVEEPMKVIQGEYDAVLIRLAPAERTPEELEAIILHELLHAAFPSACRKGNTSPTDFFTNSEHEKWVETKTQQLLKQYGHLARQ
jgi:hypothetical protein